MRKNLNTDKDLIRRQLLKKRLDLDPVLARLFSERIQMHFLGAQCYLNSSRIGLYAPIDNEVDTRMIFIKARKEGKQVLFPKIISPGEMLFMEVSEYQEMVPNRYGILEPDSKAEQVPVAKLDLIVVPGVGFDRRGYRLGFGGGYYDRVLAGLNSRTITVGFAYSFQLLERLPREPQDQMVKRILTEQGFIQLYNKSELNERR